jgi:hypothetical protein
VTGEVAPAELGWLGGAAQQNGAAQINQHSIHAPGRIVRIRIALNSLSFQRRVA